MFFLVIFYLMAKLPVNVLRGSVTDSFAHLTIKDRWPKILAKTVDNLVKFMHEITNDKGVKEPTIQDTKHLIQLISELSYGIQRNRTFPSEYCELYMDYINEMPLSERSWFSSPWLISECLMYICLNSFLNSTSGNLYFYFKR